VDMSPRTRSLFMVAGANPPAGTSFDLPIRRNGETHDVTVQFAPVEFLGGGTGIVVSTLAGYALSWLMAVLGLLLLWRGRSRAALGVALWCLTNVAQSLFAILPLPLPYCTISSWTGTVLANVGTLAGLYLVADDLTLEARSPQARAFVRNGFTAGILLYLIAVAAYNVEFYLKGTGNAIGIDIVVGLHLLDFAIPLGILLVGYRLSSPINRARIRWVSFSLLGLMITYVLGLVVARLGLDAVVVSLGATVLTAAAFSGFAYAVLKHRLVSLELVLNRALVYGLITSLVVGVFAALLAFLERTALNTETNRFLALLIPLLLGMGLNALKQRVDLTINRYLFRHRHRAEAALGQFARTCAFVEDPERLLDLAAEEVFKYSGSQNLAIYLSQPGAKGAKLARQRGAPPFPAKLAADDLAFLRLKAGDAEVDLHGTTSALGADGYAYGLMVRGEVLGFILCGPRPAEAYSLEERRLFGQVAHQAGVALHALRLQEQQRLLRDIADGAYKSLPTARAKAKALIGPRLAS